MISIDKFLEAAEDPAVLDKELNPEQEAAVRHGLQPALRIVAGPGSGKTTVLVLRALRHVLVDGFEPENVLITTFTRKAAGELRDRLIDWGTRLIDHFSAAGQSDVALAQRLARIDVNSFQTGTLDSFLQDWLRAIRPVGEPNRIMLEQFAAKFIFRRKVFSGNIKSPTFGGPPTPFYSYLAQFSQDGRPPMTVAQAADKSFEICNRLMQDLVDVNAWVSQGTTPGDSPGQTAEVMLKGLLDSYLKYLDSQRLVDFSTCAKQILHAAQQGVLYPNASIPAIRALLVDEYQDTNPIQEAIYFELAKRSHAAFTVVGDDDQSLYRFRGATVELFTNFEQRYQSQVIQTAPHPINLMRNYRSSPQIVKFFNDFSTYDAQFGPARVAQKPAVIHTQPDGPAVLGLFRDSPQQMASELSEMLDQIFVGNGFTVPGTTTKIERDPAMGALGDALFLSSTVREFKEDDAQTPRLPRCLRDELEQRNLGVFNPRGQDLRDIPNVRLLLGLIAECVDPTPNLEASLYLVRKARDAITDWRQEAVQFINSNPFPSGKGGLSAFVNHWKMRKAQSGKKWPDEWPLLDLIYKLIAWIPAFQDDPEHQIYLEAITRCVAQGGNYSAYNLDILNQQPVPPANVDHNERSVKSVFSDVLSPLALREVEVDEDLLFALPRSRLNIMTIHQSKGLEFPLVIVDVGSEFNRVHWTQAFRRFPSKPSAQAVMEDHFANHTPIGGLRVARNATDRTFDDLMRLYYVAYSRPKHVLVLVGTTACMRYASKIQNMAMFWMRNGDWHWRKNNPALTKNSPAWPEMSPLHLI